MKEKTGIGRFVTALFLAASPCFADATAVDGACEGTPILTSPDVWRGFAAAGEQPCRRLHVGSAALLTLTAAVPLTSAAEPMLLFEGGKAALREISARQQVFLIPEAGTFFVRLKAHDPTLPLGAFRVRIDLEEAFLGKATEEQEIEPDRPLLRCSPPEDDHGDISACSTFLPLDSDVVGELHNAWGDDIDVFRFELTEPRKVLLETVGPTDTVGVLEEDRGYRLALDDNAGEGENFRLQKALLPGLYFLRLEGRLAAEGPYRLLLKTEDW